MKLFRVKGLKHPGLVHLKDHGEVKLSDIGDDLAEKLWREGLPFLELTDKGRAKFYPDQKPIEVKKAKQPKTASKKKTKAN